MKKNRHTIRGNHVTLLLLLLALIPTGGKAQLFGGVIFTKKTENIPTNITLAQNQRYFVASAYDANYLPYTAPTVPASTTTVAADGTNETTIIDIQGVITTTGITLPIAVTATGSGTLPAYSNIITVPAALTEDGISRDLIFSWSEQAYSSGTTKITASIKAIGGTLNIKKLDINAGIGNDKLGVLICSFSYPYNNLGTVTVCNLRAIPGIPDRMFGKADNSGTIQHNFLYLPIIAEDGKTWLNNNLGANWANLDSGDFDLSIKPNYTSDWKGYGSLFQWGRKADGHELIVWTSATTGTPKYGTTTTKNDNPSHTLFISVSGNWRVNQDPNLWSINSANNPCPDGFRPPTNSEINNWEASANLTGAPAGKAANSKLGLTCAGYRSYLGTLTGTSTPLARYYTSSATSNSFSTYPYYRSYTGTTMSNTTIAPAYGQSVRCIKN